MKKIGRRLKSARIPVDRSIRTLVGAFKINSPSRYADLYRFRRLTSSDELFSAFPRIFQDRQLWETMFGEPTPREIGSLLKLNSYAPTGVINEIIWACARAIQLGDQIARFLTLSSRLEQNLLLDAHEESLQLINRIKEEFGISIWLIQVHLALQHRNEGFESATRLLQTYLESDEVQPITQLILQYTSTKLEGSAIKDQLSSELSRAFQSTEIRYIEKYLRAKLFELSDLRVEDYSAVLYIDAYASQIDYYESLIRVLQSVASNNSIPLDLCSDLQKPIASMHNKTKDPRLEGVARALGIELKAELTFVASRSMAIEAYTCGDYKKSAELALSRILEAADDTAMYALYAKAKRDHAVDETGLSELQRSIIGHFERVVRLEDEQAYASALELITLFERFHACNWSHHLKAILLHELRREQLSFPPMWLRDVFVRDQFLSPFSAIAATESHSRKLISAMSESQHFPGTLDVYRAYAAGESAIASVASRDRLTVYSARYWLNHDEAQRALAGFNEVIDSLQGVDKARVMGGIALAHVLLKSIDAATRSLMEQIIDKPHTSSVLPIGEVAEAMTDPDSWPNHISTPLLLELYASQLKPEKITDARYAFERFQLNNEIQHPLDLVNKRDEFGDAYVIAYMENVWRPEIMRQTIIYETTREIDETRIEVCRALMELTKSSPSSKLAEEIKDRVKKLEIAKGTSLVQQSKVYVDIEAIKRTLRTKLTEPYARYKSSFDAARYSETHHLDVITSMFTGLSEQNDVSVGMILSRVHLIGQSEPPLTEADAQFATIFAEVTNEFLLGNHGLNAFLSTRVRHGTLANTLRKPVADENLVTAKTASGKGYTDNKHWRFPENPMLAAEIQRALAEFAEEFDSITTHLNDELIQVNTLRTRAEASSEPQALFIYPSSFLERRHMQLQSGTPGHVDDLIDSCLDRLWEKTDINLKQVQHVIRSRIKNMITASFDKLSERLRVLSRHGHLDDLESAVARARTGVLSQLTLVTDWFRRSEVFDRQDYSPDFPVNIALNMLRSSITGIDDWEGLTIEPHFGGGELLPGRTLDAMVDIFDCAIENAIKHSGLTPANLQVNISLQSSDGNFRASVKNNMSTAAPSDTVLERVAYIRNLIQAHEGAARAQREEGSGLTKIWRALGATAFRDPRLDFGFSEQAGDNTCVFTINFEFNFEKVVHENTFDRG